MEWQQLLGFYHVAKQGSFTRAAEATFRTQSALSQQIKALEQELDCQLFERLGKRKLRLTPAGEKFFRCAAALLERYEACLEELQELHGVMKGPLRLAAPFTTLYHLFRGILTKFARQYPQVQLTILDRSQREVIELVKHGDVDFGIAQESVAPGDLDVRRWQQVDMVLMVPAGHPLAGAQEVTIQQIAAHPLILPPRGQKSAGRQTLEALLQEHRLEYHVIMESSNVELSSLYVEMGLGISFATIVKDLPTVLPRKVSFVPLNHYFPADYIAIIMRKNKYLNPYNKAFLDMLFDT